MGSDPRRWLIPTSSKKVGGGQGSKGPWELFEVNVTDENGNPIDQKFTSFADPKIGEKAEFYVKPYEKDGQIKSYTLTAVKKQGGGSLGPKVDELRERVEELEKRVAYLIAKSEGGKGPETAGSFTPPAAPDPQEQIPGAQPATKDEDIPF